MKTIKEVLDDLYDMAEREIVYVNGKRVEVGKAKAIKITLTEIKALLKCCKKCSGWGYYADHDLPSRHGEDGECVSCPIQVPCEDCYGTGYNPAEILKLLEG